MLIRKTLLAAAAVFALAAPAAAMAQDFGAYHDGGRYDGRYEQRRFFAWRQVERERQIRRDEWRAYRFWAPHSEFHRDFDR